MDGEIKSSVAVITGSPRSCVLLRRAAFANADGDDAIEECVRFGRGLESRHGPKVVECESREYWRFAIPRRMTARRSVLGANQLLDSPF